MEINSFRGIKHEDLKLDSKSLVLLGENGTGKSSIVQAIEYLFTSEVGALKGKGRGDLRHNTAIKFFGKSNNALNVKAVFNDNTTIERNKNGLIGSDETKSLIKSVSKGSNILNRRKLLEFVDSQPKERYDAIGKLFGYEQIDSVEIVFKKEHNAIEKTLMDKIDDYTKSIKTLSIKLGLDFKPKFKKISKKNKFSYFESSKSQYEVCIEELNRRIDGKFPKLEKETGFEKYLNNLQETLNSNNKKQAKIVLDSISSIDDLNSRQEELDKILLKYEQHYLESAKNANLLLNLLDNSMEYILVNNSTVCPVCKTDINTEELCENMSVEIKELKTTLQSIESLKRETFEFIDYLKELDENYKFIEKQIELIEDQGINEILECQRGNIITIEKLIMDLESMTNYEIGATEISKTLNESNAKLMVVDKYLKSNYLEVDTEYQQRLDFLNQSIILLINLKKTQKDIDKLKKEFNIAETVYKVYNKEKVNYIKNTLRELIDRINEYYSYIHKGDDINNLQFEVSGPSGLKLKMDCFKEESDPREYSSEGHLDTLGLCIFLAFIKENSTIPIIVLDDIVATVDSSHKERIARLLLDEFDDYQLIITTHNKMWFKQIKQLTKARERKHRKENRFKNYQFLEIKSWNIDEGPHLSNHKTDIQTIQKHLINNDLVAAVHASRRYLENVLRNVCMANRARVIYKETPYSLLEYFNSAQNEVIYKTKGSDLEYYYDEVFFEIEQVRFLGNSFVHGDEEDDLTFNEAKTFCDAVFELQEAVTCEECGSYIEFNKHNHKGLCTNKKCQSSFDL